MLVSLPRAQRSPSFLGLGLVFVAGAPQRPHRLRPRDIRAASPEGPGNAPWLLLRVVSEQGQRIFAQVRAVIRTDTHGGGTPSQACTAANQGMTVKVPYSARYVFFSRA